MRKIKFYFLLTIAFTLGFLCLFPAAAASLLYAAAEDVARMACQYEEDAP